MFSSEFMNIFLFNLMYNLPHGLDQFLLQDYKSQESSTQLLDTFLNFTSLLKCVMYQLGLSVAITE